MSRYRIKATGEKLYYILMLKNVCGGWIWEQIGGLFESKEAAQAYIDQKEKRRPL